MLPANFSADGLLHSRRAVVVALVACGALRLAYFGQYLDLPFLDGPLWDSLVYLRQAESVRSGDFGNASLIAFSPLYGYVLYALGAPTTIIFAPGVQLLVGLANVFLLFVIADRLFGRIAGLSALALAGGYGVLPFFDVKLMSETVALFLLLTGLLLAHGGREQTAPRRMLRMLAAGVFLALAVLARASLLISVPLIAVGVALKAYWDCAPSTRPRGRVATGLSVAAPLCLGVAFVLLAHGAWAYAHTRIFVPVILKAKTLAKTTDRQWDLSFGSLGKDATPPSPWDVVNQAEETIIRAQAGRPAPNLGTPSFDAYGYMIHIPAKLVGTLSDLEQSIFDYGYYGERSALTTLRAFPVSFGFMLFLAVVGLGFSLRQKRWDVIFVTLPILLGIVAVTTLFHPSSRYRLPMVIPLCLLGGYAVSQVVGLPNPRHRRIAVSLTVVVFAGFATRSALYSMQTPAFWQLRLAESYLRPYSGSLSNENLAAGLACIERASALAPRSASVRRNIAMLRSRFVPTEIQLGTDLPPNASASP